MIMDIKSIVFDAIKIFLSSSLSFIGTLFVLGFFYAIFCVIPFSGTESLLSSNLCSINGFGFVLFQIGVLFYYLALIFGVIKILKIDKKYGKKIWLIFVFVIVLSVLLVLVQLKFRVL